MSENKDYLILVINPGSTSTKVAIFKNRELLAKKEIYHKPEELSGFEGILDQREYRAGYIKQILEENGITGDMLSAVVGRGGLIKRIESGTYLINDKMVGDLVTGSASAHASALGGLIAYDIGKQFNIPAYVVDPIVVDEMEQVAKLSGIPGIERSSAFHALNTKAVARIYCKERGVRYEDGRFVIAHMGGGISVGAHRYGRVIDVNDALLGEGPFSPERCGSVPLLPFIDMCFSGKFTKAEMSAFSTKAGGMLAYLGTNNLKKVEKMIRLGDEYAALVVDSMAYQVCKEIGAMVAVLEGNVDAIILTGGLAHSVRFTGSIKQRVGNIAPVVTYPGEDEMQAMMEGTLGVLIGERQLKEYE